MAQLLQQSFLDNELAIWLRAAVAFIAVFALLQGARSVLVSRLSKLAGRTSSDVDDLIVDLLRRTRKLFLFAMALGVGSAVLTLSEKAQDVVKYVVVGALFFQTVIWSNGVINYTIHHLVSQQKDEDRGNIAIFNALGTVTRVLLVVLFFLTALWVVGVQITPLIAGLGVGGIAIALAVQNILSDLFGAISILIDKPFAIGDFVVIDDMKGTIEHIGLKTTRVRSLGGEQIVFSNADLLQSRIRNYKQMQERRIVFTIGVTYQTDQATLARIPGMIRQIVESQPDVRFDRSHFLKYADSWLEYETVYWVLKPEYNIYADIQQNINLELFRQFTEQGIDFAYPTQTLHMEGLQTTREG